MIEIAKTLYKINDLAYHNLDHIHRMLNDAQMLCAAQNLPFTHELELAVWYHDVIYKPNRSDNEYNSALLFEVIAETTNEDVDVEVVSNLINLTAKHSQSLELNNDYEMIMLDADVLSLGSHNRLYLINSENIRKEYDHLSDVEFDLGRQNWLISLLTKDRLFYTEYAYNNFEASARINLKKELSKEADL